MRTTLDLPVGLVEEARSVLGFKSKTDTVVLALREIVRRRRIDELKDLLGRVELDVDVAEKARPESVVIVVDTSVWVRTLRAGTSPEADLLRSLLDADEACLAVPVRVELLMGASRLDRPRLRRVLSALPMVYPSDETWRVIDAWVDIAGAAGQRFAFADLLIGALAREAGSLVWSLDADFERMSRLGLVDLYEP